MVNIISLYTLAPLLELIGDISVMSQNPKLDLLTSTNMVKSLLEVIKNMCNDTSWNNGLHILPPALSHH